MTRTIRVLSVLFLLIPLGCAGTKGRPAPGRIPSLHVEGKFLKDALGNPVVLRGVNYHRFVDVPDGGWDAPGAPLYSGMGKWDPEVVRETLEGYRRYGFNAVRFHTVVDWWKKNPSTYRDPYREVKYPLSYRDMMEETVRMAGEAGLYVIFDFFAMKNLDGRQSGQESIPWGVWNRHPDVVRDRADFVEVWRSVAARLGRHPNVLFELYNEPNGDEKVREEWFRFVREVLPVIRERSPNPVVVQWDSMAWVNLDFPPPMHRASTLSWMAEDPLDDPNVIYGTHLYRNSGGGGGGSVHRGDSPPVRCHKREDLARGLQLMGFDTLEKPLIVTEIGAFLKNGGEDRNLEIQWLKDMLSLLNERGIGYLGWGWASQDQIDHGMLKDGRPNEAGEALIEATRQ